MTALFSESSKSSLRSWVLGGFAWLWPHAFFSGPYLYAKTYKSLLEAIGPEYISIHPNLPFLIFVPVVGVIFYIMLALSLKTALARLHQDGRLSLKTDAVSKSMLAFCACMLLTIIPMVSQFMLLAALICLGFNWSHAVNTRKLVLMGEAK